METKTIRYRAGEQQVRLISQVGASGSGEATEPGRPAFGPFDRLRAHRNVVVGGSGAVEHNVAEVGDHVVGAAETRFRERICARCWARNAPPVLQVSTDISTPRRLREDGLDG